ncbi:hypothetical protein QBC32DRAFT_405423 [Pseudoneurospora amorphoporcata]|uniref:SnoaL-like domain-containing protein n=1 Tax=Pseudoneurospora amorphoporcata TaxID=241081 RepID=A0AAN6NXB7_9PEZI|nr:hypothetical protein QBC32DRAFT_405423 [Pseudoneurospora amorphoporcata]
MASTPAESRIQSQKLRYCRYADTQQFSLLPSVILPSCTFKFIDYFSASPIVETSASGPVTLRFDSLASWTAYFSEKFKALQTMHLISGAGEFTKISEDECEVVFAVIYHAAPKEGETEWQGAGGGHYHERWVKQKDEEGKEDWFMKSLRFERLYWKYVE